MQSNLKMKHRYSFLYLRFLNDFVQRLILQVEEKVEVTDIGKGGEEQAAGFEQKKVFDKVEVTDKQEVEVTDKHVEVTDKQVEVTDKQEKIVVKVDAGVQHNGFFETSFEVSPASEDPEPEREVSQVVRKDWGSQTPVLHTQDWSGQL